jgi:3-hydroxypropanoate dehydrogenase
VSTILSDSGLDLLFREAHTHNAWQDKPVSNVLLQAIYDLAKMAPTSANCSPLRVLFVTSREAKEKLKPALSAGNRDKTMAAPATAILAYDLAFYEHLARLFPHNAEARSWFAGKPKHIRQTAFRNGSLQGAYFILAARALGLDCGPMSGFDNDRVDQAFFPDGEARSNFLCNLGYGDPAGVRPRGPRFDFDEVCQIL